MDAYYAASSISDDGVVEQPKPRKKTVTETPQPPPEPAKPKLYPPPLGKSKVDRNPANRMIMIAVMFIVGYVYFVLLSFLRLPHLKVFAYALPPHDKIIMGWDGLKQALAKLFAAICIALLLLWILWIIIKKFVPNFPIPFKLILLKIPPFPQLERTGIFALMSAIVRLIGGDEKGWKRVGSFFKVVASFIAINTELWLNLVGIQTTPKNKPTPNTDRSSANPPMSAEDRKRRNREEAEKQPPFESSEQRQIDDEYQQCLEENTKPVTVDMSNGERRATLASNSFARVACRTRTLQSYMRLTNLR
jgi:hypothetical protein